MVAFTFNSFGTSAPSTAFCTTSCLLLFFLLIDGVIGEIISSFKSRPDLYPPVFTVETSVPEKLSPGYIFVAPYEAENPGPYIYDTQGNLVWSGWGSSGPGNAHGMHVCKYNGADHLCFFQGNQQKGYCRGHGVILDNRYRIVRSVQAGGGMSSSDMHEFMPINGGKTALMTVYQQRQFDMSAWNVKTGMGWLMESIFQEVDIETSEVLFEWRSLDHVDPSASYTYPDHTDTSGNGLDPHSPWDYFHINSIDKNDDGDYLISSRHTSCVYKISGKDGSIIWRLHGANPSFKNINFSFSQQHDARWLHENSTHTLLSLYNNGYNGFNRTHAYSSGMTILIDHRDKTATQIRDYVPPGKNMISSSQGNMQVLPNKNIFMGWGNNAYVSEHDEQGNLLFWGYIAKDHIMNYRAMKFEWDGNPTDVPAMWTYSKTAESNSPTSFYVSWNGATRVRSWRFYGSTNQTGPYGFLAEVEKRGFETSYTHPSFYSWTHVQAIDAQGKVLGRSTNKFTFVPSPELRDYCADEFCVNAPGYGFPGDEGARPIIPSLGTYNVPWVDPEHPHEHFTPVSSSNGQSSGNQQGHQNLLTEHPSWVVPALGVGAAIIAIYLVLRWYCRQQRYKNMHKQRDSTDNLEGMDQHQSELGWWNWRRWTGEPQQERHHYFPLTEPSTHENHRR